MQRPAVAETRAGGWVLGAPRASTRTEWIHPFSTLFSKYLHGVPWGFNPSKRTLNGSQMVRTCLASQAQASSACVPCQQEELAPVCSSEPEVPAASGHSPGSASISCLAAQLSHRDESPWPTEALSSELQAASCYPSLGTASEMSSFESFTKVNSFLINT
ncbi:unnamed protein product [Rangifer tarandus platyrhynchus]|uniref:Uncharacterized protein n=1 Tax=Rangifer tarandus platyrhynchus TaxID=3082113 RepID=A0AC59Y477_RANTA